MLLPQYQAAIVYSILPTDRQAYGEAKSDPRTVSAHLRQLPPIRLESLAGICYIYLQYLYPCKYRYVSADNSQKPACVNGDSSTMALQQAA
jgi:hypothetical protein